MGNIPTRRSNKKNGIKNEKKINEKGHKKWQHKHANNINIQKNEKQKEIKYGRTSNMKNKKNK